MKNTLLKSAGTAGILALSTAALLAPAPARADVLAHWSFNDPVGSTTAADSSGNGETAMAQGTSPAVRFGITGPSDPGTFGTGVSLDGESDAYFTTPLGNDALVGSQHGFSISVWINPADTTTQNNILCDWSSPLYSIRLIEQNGAVTLQERNSSSQDAITETFGAIPTDTWTQVGVTYDKDDGQFSEYINGADVGDYSVAAFTPMLNSQVLGIGIKQDSGATSNISLNNMWITDTPLTDDQMASLYTLNAIPEPGTTVLLGLATAGMLVVRRRRGRVANRCRL